MRTGDVVKKRMHVSIPRQHPAVVTAAAFMLASAVVRLWHYIPQKLDTGEVIVQVLLPVGAAAVFLACLAIGGKWPKRGALMATGIGVAFFIIKATTFAPLHRTLCTILYCAVLIIFSSTLLGYLPTKKLLYPLFGLPLIYHIIVEDTQLYFFADTPVPVWEWMPEMSVLCIMAALLSMSIALKTEKIN